MCLWQSCKGWGGLAIFWQISGDDKMAADYLHKGLFIKVSRFWYLRQVDKKSKTFSYIVE